MSIGVGRNVRTGRRSDYRASELLVERAFEIVLELVHEHLGIRGRDDCAFTRYVATEDSTARRRLLLGLQPAHKLNLGLRTQQYPERTHSVEVIV